jgi:TIR domain/HEAT repeats/NB-ARC domain/PBS lyase HEAT-like repeat
MGAATAPQPEYDIFFSYSHADDEDGWVSALVSNIQAEHARYSPQPLGIFFDRSSIRTMDDWEHYILGGLRSSKTMIALLSPAYFASAFCRTEWKTFLEHELDRANAAETVAPVYLADVPAFDHETEAGDTDWIADLRRRQYSDFRQWRSLGLAAFGNPECQRRIAALEQDLAPKIEKAERALASPSNVPPHNPQFTGRAEQLRRLWELVALRHIGSIVALQGLPGMGKSALAFEYAHQHAADYPGGRFLLNAAGATDLRVPLVDLAPQLGVTISEDQRKSLDTAFGVVRARLETGARTLLIFDNVDNAALLEPHRRGDLPSTDRVHVILTTRLAPQYLPGIECEPMSGLREEDSLRLLERYRPFANDEEKTAALEIVRRLDGYPLELEIVAVYLWQSPDITYAAYLDRFRHESLLAVEGAAQDETVTLSRHSQKSLSGLLQPMLDSLSDLERFALGLAALFHPDFIPLPWVRDFLAARGILPETPPGYPNPWRQLERRLLGLRFLTGANDPNLARMHRVIQEVVAGAYPQYAGSNLRAMGRYAIDRAQEVKFNFDAAASRPAPAFWEWQAIDAFASFLLDKEEADAGCALAYFAASIVPWRVDENERLLTRAIALAPKAQSSNADRDRFLTTCYIALADLFVLRDRYRDATSALSTAAELSRIDPDLAAQVQLKSDYVTQAENQYYFALSKMRNQYWDSLESLGADHPDTRNLYQWLGKNDPTWIRRLDPVPADTAASTTEPASRAELHGSREIARIERFLSDHTEYLPSGLVEEFRHLVESGLPSGEIRDRIVPVVLDHRYEREGQKPGAAMPFPLAEMYQYLRHGILGLANGGVQSYSGRPSFEGPLEHWLEQVVGKQTGALLDQAVRLGCLIQDDGYDFRLIVRDHLAFGHFLAALGDRTAKYRSHAALILGDIGDPRAVDTMLSVLQDDTDDPLVRSHVALGLGSMQDLRPVVPLLLLFDDEHEVTRDGVFLKAFAKAGLRRIGNLALDVVYSTLADPRPLLRAAAIDALFNLGEPRAIPRLQALFTDGTVIPPNRLGIQGKTIAERSYNAVELLHSLAKNRRG